MRNLMAGREDAGGSTVIFSKGNSGDMANIWDFCLLLAIKLRVNVVMYDYVGYGISKGNPTEYKCINDLESVLAFTVEHLGIPLNKVILWGYSLGSGPTIGIIMRVCLYPVVNSLIDVASRV